MGEDNEQKNDPKEQQKQEEQEASKKALKTGAKAAATAYAGPMAGKAVDLASKTKLGDAALNAGAKSLNRKPGVGKMANIANKSGALDAADKGVDLASGGGIGGKEGLPPTGGGTNPAPSGSPSSTSASSTSSQSGKSSNSSTGGLRKKASSLFGSSNASGDSSEESSDNESFATKIFRFIGSNKQLFISIFGGFLLLLVIIVAVIAIAGSIVGGVVDFFNGIRDSFIGFFNKDQEELMDNYYNTLKDVQTEFNQKYGVCIDVNLITAALTVNKSPDDFIEDGNIDDPSGDSKTETNADGSTTEIPYKKMTKQIKLLANMQIMTNIYGLDKEYKKTNESYCSSQSSSVLVDSTKVNSYDGKTAGTGEVDSSNYELIASHDVSNFTKFFTKKSDEEKNYAYYLYYPTFDIDGTCTDSYAKKSLPEEKKELSIGNLATKEESVFYWNLVNSFIPDYYEEYLPSKDSSNYLEEVKKIAEDIYLLYDNIGPSQTCATSYQGPSSLCPNGITIDGVGTIDFEEYVAGVVSGESYSSEGIEALKAQAVAARTYALNLTNYCSSSITSSTNAQVFTRDINDKAKQATASTAGEILVDSNGKIFSSQYDSFCYDDKDCPDSKRNSDGTYTVTYTRLPSGEKHTITLSDSSQYGRILNGQGHARGMSQLVSYQMAKEGKSYQEILSYFYSDGVSISLVLSPTTTEGGTIIDRPIEHYLSAVGTNIDNMNQTIFSQVRKAGVGTRQGVVTAAITLINNFYSQTGYLLPYELYPSGKFAGYGMDPSWGSNTGRTDYPSNGLDCSGFVSWAIHNGGFGYEVKSAKGWGESSIKRAWSRGMTDSSAKPGDLIYNAPQSANGTTGHIRMIVEVTKEGYVVAEASGRKNGVRIKTISFTSTGPYYLVDMDSYYASATRVTDYPQ